jgi:hypothetical protein
MNLTDNNMIAIGNLTDNETEYVVDPSSDCPDYDKSGDLLLDNLGFYLEGILQTSLAIAGLLSNFISCLVLASKEMRNSFNLVTRTIFFKGSHFLIMSV